MSTTFQEPRHSSRLVVISQEKGGVGKTTTAIELAQFYNDRGHHFLTADLDFEPRLLTKVYPECGLISPDPEYLRRRTSNAFEMVDLARKGENLLVDCGANSLPFWQTLWQIEPDLLRQMQGRGVGLTLLVPVDADQDTQDMFHRYSQFFPGFTKILVSMVDRTHGLAEKLGHPTSLTIYPPDMPVVVADAICRFMKPLQVLASMPEEDLGFPHGLAENAHNSFTTEFTRIQQYLLP